MDARTRDQLLEINRAFYAAHAAEFDRSRGDRAWPGWEALLAHAESAGPLACPDVAAAAPIDPVDLGAVLDLGCGNGRFACFLHARGHRCRYTGIDANAALLDAARQQLPRAWVDASQVQLLEQDFLKGPLETIGHGLPAGPFDWVVLMGVLHHVPSAPLRRALLESAARRLAPGGLLALATWQFPNDPRQARKRIPWSALGPVLGAPVDPAQLEPGDALLRFGEDRSRPPRYCHAVSLDERVAWPETLGLEPIADFFADGARGDANHYLLLRAPGARAAKPRA